MSQHKAGNMPPIFCQNKVMKSPKASQKISGCLDRSACPVTNVLDLIGDKWTLLIIRDMLFLKKTSFSEFLESPEGIATNILTERLRRLEEHGLIEKHFFKKTSARYEYFLTRRGEDLRSLLMEMVRWGNAHIEGTMVPPKKLLKK